MYTIGHAAAESDATEPIVNGEYTYLVHPSEVLSAAEAIELLQHYYDNHAVPAPCLRTQDEFTTPAEGGG